MTAAPTQNNVATSAIHAPKKRRSIYDISDNLITLLNIEAEEDELEPDLAEMFEQLEGERDDKFRSLFKVLRRYEGLLTECENELERLGDLKKNYQNQVERIKDIIDTNLRRLNVSLLELGICKFRYQNNPHQVIVRDQSKIPQIYLNAKMKTRALGSLPADVIETLLPEEIVVNKTALKSALKAGQSIEGAELHQTNRLVIK